MHQKNSNNRNVRNIGCIECDKGFVKFLEAHCACSESLAKFMPRYFVYMSAQGLLLAGKISD